MAEMPTWEGFMVPVLRAMDDGVERHWREFQPLAGDAAGLSDDQRAITLKSGREPLFHNRIGWAVSFLTNVGALDRTKRGQYRITAAGKDLIRLFPEGLRERQLRDLGADPASPIREYQSSRRSADGATAAPVLVVETLTPLEQVQQGIDRINEEVAADLLDRLQGRLPGFFEQAVVDLLLKMGYGGATGRGTVTQLTSDGGIDGVIDQDVLGVSRVYIQAKRYASHNPVQRPDVQAFVGALAGKADSGVFITTSRFSEGAKVYADNVPTRIILIDGERLTDLMIKYEVGVQVREVFRAVEVDEDFFA